MQSSPGSGAPQALATCDRHGPPSGRDRRGLCPEPQGALPGASSCRSLVAVPLRCQPPCCHAAAWQGGPAPRRSAPAAPVQSGTAPCAPVAPPPPRRPALCAVTHPTCLFHTPSPQLDTLRQKRTALRARGDEVRGWAGGSGGGGNPLPARALSGRDAAALAAAAQRRRAGAYAVSSSSSSDAEEEGGVGASPAPTTAEATAKLFAKLGIKGCSGHDSDTSWASSPERSRIRAVHANGGGGSTHSPRGEQSDAGASRLAAELARAQATIAALQQEVAAARAQADDATAALLDAEQRAAEAQVGAENRTNACGAACGGTARALHMVGMRHCGLGRHWFRRCPRMPLHTCQQSANPRLPLLPATFPHAQHHLALSEQQHAQHPALLPAARDEEAQQQLVELAAQNEELLVQLEEAGGQLAAAAAWQAEVRAVQEQLAAMQSAVAESEAARQQQEEETAELLRQRDGELVEATARLAAAEAQLVALAGYSGAGLAGDCSGGQGGTQHLRPTAQLLAEFAVTNAQLVAALGEAAALLA